MRFWRGMGCQISVQGPPLRAKNQTKLWVDPFFTNLAPLLVLVSAQAQVEFLRFSVKIKQFPT